MFQAAEQQGLSPLRLGFTGTLRVVRRAVPQLLTYGQKNNNPPQRKYPFF